MDRIWSKLNNLDTFVHWKQETDNWRPTSINSSEMRWLRNNSTQLRNFKPSSAYKTTQFRQTKKFELPWAQIILNFEVPKGQSTKGSSTTAPKQEMRQLQKWPRKTTHPRIPWFLAKPRSDSLWKMNWKVLLLNGSQ